MVMQLVIWLILSTLCVHLPLGQFTRPCRQPACSMPALESMGVATKQHRVLVWRYLEQPGSAKRSPGDWCRNERAGVPPHLAVEHQPRHQMSRVLAGACVPTLVFRFHPVMVTARSAWAAAIGAEGRVPDSSTTTGWVCHDSAARGPPRPPEPQDTSNGGSKPIDAQP